MRLIADGVVERDGVTGLATRLGYSPRQLNRVITAELGAGPLALARAHRATNARILIQCSGLPMADVAFAAGFASVRQFNDTIRDVFGLTPSELRRARTNSRSEVAPSDSSGATPGTDISLRLAHREPLDASWLGWYLGSHAVEGLERFVGTTRLDGAPIDDGSGDHDVGTGAVARWRYRRVLSLPHGPADVTVEPRDRHMLVRLRRLDVRDLGVAVNRMRRLLDLDADVAAAEAALSADPALAPLIDAAPGVRVPGSVDPAESLMRTMIGQQISVKAARTHVTDLVRALGEPTEPSGHGETAGTAAPDAAPDAPTLRFPSPAAIAESGHRILRGPARRIEAIVGAARAIADGTMELHPGLPASELRHRLVALPGVGDWTASYVAMQISGDPDTLLDRDLVVRQAAADLGVDLGATMHWAPWRSYASMHLWRHRLVGTDR
ncbi:Ada metal-binding domain-containing protein [Gordonia sinesedis]